MIGIEEKKTEEIFKGWCWRSNGTEEDCKNRNRTCGRAKENSDSYRKGIVKNEKINQDRFDLIEENHYKAFEDNVRIAWF